MKFDGKKLLVLGSNVSSVDIIKYARSNGAYTVETDFLPKEKSVAKYHCDESLLISTADTENLCDYVVKNHVDGVLAGISEFNLLQAMKVCRRCGLPFYCDENQWNSIEDKGKFRRLCMKYAVPCPQTYYVGNRPEDCSGIRFPAIVKPTDSSASVGVSICENKTQYQHAVLEALAKSKSASVIVEEFFCGDEFTAHYSIVDGVPYLVSVDNRYSVSVNEGTVTTIPIARIYPSSFLPEYRKQVNDSVMELCSSLNLKAGVVFVQGLYNKEKDKFCVFEAGLRSAGEAPYRFLEYVNGENYIHNLVDYALTGQTTDYDPSKEDPEIKGKSCAVVSFVSKGGVVGRIFGYDEIRGKVPTIVCSECRYNEGDTIPSGNTLHQIVLRFVLVCDSKEKLKEDIGFINNNVQVLDLDGNDMCLKFNPSVL